MCLGIRTWRFDVAKIPGVSFEHHTSDLSGPFKSVGLLIRRLLHNVSVKAKHEEGRLYRRRQHTVFQCEGESIAPKTFRRGYGGETGNGRGVDCSNKMYWGVLVFKRVDERDDVYKPVGWEK
jgi:hypothetical protein